jgi:hypothetical protein
MIISTSSHNILLSTELDAFVHTAMHQALDRLGEDILSIDVFLKDVNGPKGGVDKQVIVRLHLRNRHQLAIETLDENLYAAVRRSAKRAKTAVRRSLRKSRRIEKFRMHKRLDSRRLTAGLNA